MQSCAGLRGRDTCGIAPNSRKFHSNGYSSVGAHSEFSEADDSPRVASNPAKKSHMTAEGYINVNTSLAIITGLCMAVGLSGFFSDIPDVTEEMHWFIMEMRNNYLLVWCVVIIFSLYGTSCFAVNLTFASLVGQDGIDAFVEASGKKDYLGGMFFLVSTMLMYVGCIFHMFLTPGHNHLLLCIILCLGTFLVLPWFCIEKFKAFRHALNGEEFDERSAKLQTLSSPTYAKLEKYFVEEKQGDLFKVKREEFLSRCRPCGEVEEMLAGMVYDDWLKKQLKGMLREEPGF